MSIYKENLYRLQRSVDEAVLRAESGEIPWIVALDSVLTHNRMLIPHAVSIPLFIWEDVVDSMPDRLKDVYDALPELKQRLLETDFADDLGSMFDDTLLETSDWQLLMRMASEESGFYRALEELRKEATGE
jgi:hypothetical protein